MLPVVIEQVGLSFKALLMQTRIWQHTHVVVYILDLAAVSSASHLNVSLLKDLLQLPQKQACWGIGLLLC